ncbi:hypothetical protein D3C76_1452070 [compost metagenome]
MQFAQHKAFDTAVELTAADAIDGIDHIADRAGDVAHQTVSEQNGDTHAQQQQQGGNEDLFVLLQANRLQIQLDRHITQAVVLLEIAAGSLVRVLAL